MIRARVTIRTLHGLHSYHAIGPSSWALYEAAQKVFPLAAISVMYEGEVRA